MPSESKLKLPNWLPQLSYEVLVSAWQMLGDADWLLVGALARDYAFRDSADLRTLRATMDVDVAVLVTGWPEFNATVGKLCRSGGFVRTAMAHRLRHANGQLMDILPFGGVEVGHRIAWPPRGEPEMTVLGFRDVLAASTTVVLAEGINVKVAPPAAVGFMKLIAWHDNPSQRQRDLEDIATLIRGYVTELLGWDAAHEKYGDVMTANEFDLYEAGAYILGCEMAGLLSPDVRDETLRLVAAQHDLDRRFTGGMEEYLKISFDHAQRVCEQLMRGLGR